MNNLEELKKKYVELGMEIARLEEQKENKRWRAAKEEIYWVVFDDGDIGSDIEAKNVMDDYRYKTRNYFKTKQEAQEYLDKINIYWELADLAEELNNGEEIDWTNALKDKYCIRYDCTNDYIYRYIACSNRDFAQIYCLDKNFLEIAKERIGEKRLLKLFK